MSIFVGVPSQCSRSLNPALGLATSAIRSHTRHQYSRQFKLYLAFTVSRGFKVCDGPTCVMMFLEFLASNGITFRVVNNYVSALKFAFSTYGWNLDVFECVLVKRLLRVLGIHVTGNQHQMLYNSRFHKYARLCVYARFLKTP